MKSTMHPIHTLIDKKYLQRAKNIQSLTTSIHSRLPSKLHRHCWLVSLDNNALNIVTDSPERAATIRYQQHEIVKQVNEEFAATLSTPIKKLKIKIDLNLAKISDLNEKSTQIHHPDRENAKNYCNKMMELLKK